MCCLRGRAGESSGYIVKRHALRNLVLPAITLQFGSISEIFGRIGARGAGIFLSGTRTGGVDAGRGERCVAAFGDHGHQHIVRIPRKSCGKCTLRCD